MGSGLASVVLEERRWPIPTVLAPCAIKRTSGHLRDQKVIHGAPRSSTSMARRGHPCIGGHPWTGGGTGSRQRYVASRPKPSRSDLTPSNLLARKGRHWPIGWPDFSNPAIQVLA